MLSPAKEEMEAARLPGIRRRWADMREWVKCEPGATDKEVVHQIIPDNQRKLAKTQEKWVMKQ